MMRDDTPMRRLARLTAALALVLLVATGAGADQNMQVTPLARDGRLLVTFRLSDAFNDDIRTAIHSGLTITFVYDVELRRGTSLWLDRTIAQATVMATVRYDNLTRRYYVTRREDGRLERADTVDREDVAREWLTSFDKLPLFSSDLLERNAEYYLRIRAHTMPRNASFVWPWERGIAGLAKFTFLQQ
jgi:uncharacterized protein DUF4390